MINENEVRDLIQIKAFNIPVSSGHIISKDTFTIFAGPCRVESYEQCRIIAESVKSNGAQVFRAGAYKPCTHPHCDWGMEEEGLKILSELKNGLGVPIITEAMSMEQLAKVSEIADIIQIGTRNAQNYSFLNELRNVKTPIFYKRGTWMNLREVLAGLEWIVHDQEGQEGNKNVMLCERGTVHFNDHMRWTLDFTLVPSVKQIVNVPIVMDISHGTGGKGNICYYKDLARAAVAIGADGLMVEVHHKPEQSKSDPDQALSLDEFAELVDYIKPVIKAVGKRL